MVEVLVLNTLAPYLDAVSPTHYVRPGSKSVGVIRAGSAAQHDMIVDGVINGQKFCSSIG